jgi:hypothetical protein
MITQSPAVASLTPHLQGVLTIALIWLPSLALVAWVYLYEEGYFLRKKIASQRTYVEMWQYAYEQYPSDEYAQRIREEVVVLRKLELKLEARS